MKTTYKVSGMTCGGCATSVVRAIEAIKADVNADVDLAAGTVSVEGIDEDEAIGRAVEQAGFDFGGRAS